MYGLFTTCLGKYTIHGDGINVHQSVKVWKIISSWYVYQIQPQETEDHHLFTEKAVEITRNFPRRFFHIADFPRPSSSIGDLVWAAGSDQRHEGTPTSNDGFFHQTQNSDFLRQKMNLEAKKNEYTPHN